MSSIFGAISVETPKYKVIQKAAAYEIREYARQLRAEVTVDLGNNAMMHNLSQPFSMLAGYIFGQNTKRSGQEGAEKVAMTAPVLMSQQPKHEKVAMTAPVLMSEKQQEQQGKNMTMSFILPSKYSRVEELPVPLDKNVKLVEVPEHKMAVVRFSGTFSEPLFTRKEEQLRAAAAADGVKLNPDRSAVVRAAYNPPWTLWFLRTNEVMVPVVG
mmetsp:Transcript_35995/g.80110  ORF Transcript_35995/g.80110 Transcript_35995/m.80110 type:complete len:213 (+) Transcript_35995:128-766(+)|eukprot:CAMPEP_0202896740 /NCGR_PEP_ID=MMETSP1392-20130828/5674_1 /ASSEMBLY_ACC=CAM_ASM_000868 /TAXON_ID=225041 /ORGANISM="Chlamydomonas chlamydogama, Strain SAG 11-48b" /LENGTH=212 /DNA_ID=CAMNT_0049582195 /DNA_START=124 /DNA_END=762 /DNA_ORIENTATION=-